MMPTLVRRVAVAFAFGSVVAVATAQAQGLFIVNQPWARPAMAGQSTEVYMDLTSTAGATLLAASSDAAATTRIRAPNRPPAEPSRVALPAGTLVALAPGGYRIALQRLRRAMKLGDRLALTLTIERNDGSIQEIPVNAEVRRHSPIEDELRAHRHPAH